MRDSKSLHDLEMRCMFSYCREMLWDIQNLSESSTVNITELQIKLDIISNILETAYPHQYQDE